MASADVSFQEGLVGVQLVVSSLIVMTSVHYN